MDQVQSLRIGVGGTGVTTMGPIPTGLQWTVYQIAAETVPARSGSVITVRKNGRFITNAPLSLGASSAQGPPFILVNPGDQLTAAFSGMVNGDTALVTWLYREHLWSETPAGEAV